MILAFWLVIRSGASPLGKQLVVSSNWDGEWLSLGLLTPDERGTALQLTDPKCRSGPGPLVSFVRFLKAALSRPKETITFRWLLPPLVKRKLFRVLRLIGRLMDVLNSKAAFEFQFRLTYELRQDALRKWEVSAAPIPITLFRSREFRSELPDYGWARKAAEVTVIPIPESHLGLPQNEELCRRFLESIREASDTKSGAGAHGSDVASWDESSALLRNLLDASIF